MTLFAVGLLSLLALDGLDSCNVSTATDVQGLDPTTLRIGFLSSFRHGLGKQIAGAIPIAVKHINQ